MADTNPTAVTPAAAPTAPMPKGGNPLIVIIVIIVVLVVCCSILGGVAYFISKNAANGAINYLNNISDQFKNDINNNLQNSNSSNSNSNNSSTGTSSTGSNLGSGNFGSGQLPSGFPSDVPVYPGSTVAFGGATHSNGKDSYSVTFSTTAGTNDIISYYKGQLQSNGWNITSEQSYFGSSVTADKDSREVTVVVLGADKAGDNSTITVAVTNK